MIGAFLEEIGWHPKRVQAAAGAFLDAEYNLVVRLVQKHVAQRRGAPTDTPHAGMKALIKTCPEWTTRPRRSAQRRCPRRRTQGMKDS
jgi:hypothetical protein